MSSADRRIVALARQTLSARGALQLEATGHSMRPLLRAGRKYNIVSHCSASPLRVGEIVLIDIGHLLLLHRIRAVTTNSFGQRLVITKGDSSGHFDSPVTDDQVIGILQSPEQPVLYALVWRFFNKIVSQVVSWRAFKPG